jgi:hypothetical protein
MKDFVWRLAGVPSLVKQPIFKVHFRVRIALRLHYPWSSNTKFAPVFHTLKRREYYPSLCGGNPGDTETANERRRRDGISAISALLLVNFGPLGRSSRRERD